MIDDGPWAGIPIGGLGTGSIGRTHRGDFARWHLEVGRHRFSPVAADAFSIFVGRPGEPGTATVLSTLRPEALPDWGWTLPEGGGTYHALFPRAWQAFEPSALGVRLVGEQLSPVIAGDLDVERAAGRCLRVVGGEPRSGPSDGRDHAELGGPRRRSPPARARRVPGTKPSSPMMSTGRSSTPRSVRRRVYAGRSPWRRPARPA